MSSNEEPYCFKIAVMSLVVQDVTIAVVLSAPTLFSVPVSCLGRAVCETGPRGLSSAG